jgi:hypothetical protein
VFDASEHEPLAFHDLPEVPPVELPILVPPFEIVLWRLQVFSARPSLVLKAAELWKRRHIPRQSGRQSEHLNERSRSTGYEGIVPGNGSVGCFRWLVTARLTVAAIASAVPPPPVSVSSVTAQSQPQAKPKPLPATKGQKPLKPVDFAAYQQAVRETALMVSKPQAQSLAASHGLQILNLTWEDTGRYKGSAVGPNISDMTIQVAVRDPKTQQLGVTCMPVIRYPNFEDESCDLDPRDFTLLVGNQTGQPLKRISLLDFLERPTEFLSHPESWKSSKKTLLAPRDSKVLVSAQACFLPVPRNGKAEFNPVLFNYQSYKENPAVLTLLVTREGSSVTIIDNTRDAFETGAVWGQRLFHNQNGQRASLTGQRESEFEGRKPATKAVSVASPGDSTGESGLNMVLLVQVPLKQKPMKRPTGLMALMCEAPASSMELDRRSDVENAVIGHGELEGPFTEMDNLSIERDERFPVRVTVQFYKATSAWSARVTCRPLRSRSTAYMPKATTWAAW